MASITLHLRSETKPLEHRSALTPNVVRKLLEKGFKINVERSPERIFDDAEFESAGATLVPEGSWPDVPKDHIIIGLKELEDKDPFPLKHTHIQFSHCYKNQGGWKEVLGRFPRGGGILYDMEFLEDANGRRVAAFGYHAGYAGAALALMDWAWQLEHGKDVPLPGKTHYAYKEDLDKEVKDLISKASEKNGGRLPRVLVTGALGRCGKGALDLCHLVAGIPDGNLLKWDLAETSAKPGPYPEIRESDVFVNCIYLNKAIPPFITTDFLKQDKRNLSVVCDVSTHKLSFHVVTKGEIFVEAPQVVYVKVLTDIAKSTQCDTTNPFNPVPFADQQTFFNKPTITLPDFENPPLSYITIDHLPSLLPREASEAFSEALLPSLLQLPERSTAQLWQKAEKLFKEKVALLPAELQ